ncbi:hypothetical protein OSTOST_25169, partial [Ostertagia ostertagi]
MASGTVGGRVWPSVHTVHGFHRYDKFSAENMKRQSEDCLYLNVFSPYTVARNIIFKGITFVTINYRLGPLGFIVRRSGDNNVDSNIGIWDQVMALQWIQSNIKQFGGDPSRVTLMGESAGGAACSLLALSPELEGLAQQAIIMSGSVTAGWAIHRHGIPSWSLENLVSYL